LKVRRIFGPASEEEKLSSEKKLKGIKALFRFQETERGYISKSIPGAIIENLLKTHPMSFLVWAINILV
jgi:mannitol-specific phosphotransferase system IIBC component